MQRGWIAAAAFLSGASALSLQLAWVRRLSVSLGHEWPAMLTVTTAYFAGLTLGSWCLAGWIRRSGRPWLWLAGLQSGCAAWGVASVPVLAWVGDASLGWLGADPSLMQFATGSLKAGAMVVLPGALMLGATFAALERSWLATGGTTGGAGTRHVGTVYGLNALGAMAGAALGLAWMQPTMGLDGTIRASAIASLASGIMGWWAGFRGETPAAAAEGAPAASTSRRPGGVGFAVLWLFLGGLLGMGLQVLAIRLTRPVLGGTVYSYATVLAAWLGGTALGAISWLRGWLGTGRGSGRQRLRPKLATLRQGGVAAVNGRGDGPSHQGGGGTSAPPRTAGGRPAGKGGRRNRHARGWRAMIESVRHLKMGLALAWVGAMAVGGVAIDFGSQFLATFDGNSPFWRTCLLEGVLVAMGAGPLAAASSAWLTRGVEQAMGFGISSGRAMAWSLAGATVAPWLIGGWMMPSFGERGAWIGALLLAVALGLALVLTRERNRRLRMAWGAGVLALAGLASALGFDRSPTPPGVQRIRRIPGMADTVEVWRWPDRSRTLSVNRRMTMGGTATASVAARQAHLPLLLHPKPGSALFLGVGTGITLAGAGAHRGLDAVGVELVPEVVQVLRDFRPENEMGPGIRVATGDARRYLRASEAKYDVIIGDLFHPERDGAAWLYTEEHFRAMRDRLASGGVACQWLPWFQLDERSRGLVVAAWLKVFPESDAWLLRWTSLDTPVVGLVHGGKRWSPSDWGKRVPNRGSLQEALRRCGYTDGWQLWGCWVGQASSLPRAMDGENTDDRPAVLWSAAKGAAIARADASKGLLAWLGTASDQKPPWFESSKADGERWDKFRKARDLYLQGLAAAIGGDDDAALAFIWRSVVASTDFPSAYSYLLETAQARGAESPAEGRAILERLARERPDIPVGRELLERMKPKPQP